MSLQLRQQAQRIIDEAGYPNLHAGISSTNHMTLQTECGQDLLAVKGVVFSRKAPNAKEISYALELLSAFLTKHKEAIDEYFRRKHACSELEVTDVPEGVQVMPSGVFFTVGSGMDAIKFKITSEEGEPEIELARYRLHAVTTVESAIEKFKARLPELMEVHKRVMLLSEAQEKEAAAMAELTKCDI